VSLRAIEILVGHARLLAIARYYNERGAFFNFFPAAE
jgi:hypothetical protein